MTRPFEQPVSPSDVEAAAERIAGGVRRTPLLPLEPGLYAKAENLQETGSFKLRGAYNFLALLPEHVRQRGVVAHSSGNHAQGVACAAYHFGVPATLVIPENAPPVKVEGTLAWGATVVRCENSSTAREAMAQTFAQRDGLTLVPPYDHPWIVAGQGTVGLEVSEDLPAVANVLVPIGGGGLASGVSLMLRARCPGAQIIGVEPEDAADAQASLAGDRIVVWDAEHTARTVADGVRTQSLGILPFAVLRKTLTGIVTVPEEAIIAATREYSTRAKLVAEPTGALTLAAYRALQRGAVQGLELQPGLTVVIISGGNVAPDWLARLLHA